MATITRNNCLLFNISQMSIFCPYFVSLVLLNLYNIIFFEKINSYIFVYFTLGMCPCVAMGPKYLSTQKEDHMGQILMQNKQAKLDCFFIIKYKLSVILKLKNRYAPLIDLIYQVTKDERLIDIYQFMDHEYCYLLDYQRCLTGTRLYHKKQFIYGL